MAGEQKTAVIIIIGNEILSGRTKDANVSYLGEQLAALGIRLAEVRIIPDVEATIVETVNWARAVADYVFTSGGIGPTHDDITSACMAKAFGVALEKHPEAVALLESHYKPEDRTSARMKMAEVPVGGTLLHNPVSKAPGYRMENVHVLPGVPRILQAIFEGFRHELEGGPPILSRTVTAFIQEGRLADGVARVQDAHPAVEIGSYPFVRDGKFGASLVVRGEVPEAVNRAIAALKDHITDLGGEPNEDFG